MPSRTVVWILAILGIALVVVPLLGMLGMMACCGGAMMDMGGMMRDGRNMMGMTAAGVVWMLAVAGVVVALIVVLVRGLTRT
jgi:hypothetical protein